VLVVVFSAFHKIQFRVFHTRHWCRVFQSCGFQFCNLDPPFPSSHFPHLHFNRAAFSILAVIQSPVRFIQSIVHPVAPFSMTLNDLDDHNPHFKVAPIFDAVRPCHGDREVPEDVAPNNLIRSHRPNYMLPRSS